MAVSSGPCQSEIQSRLQAVPFWREINIDTMLWGAELALLVFSRFLFLGLKELQSIGRMFDFYLCYQKKGELFIYVSNWRQWENPALAIMIREKIQSKWNMQLSLIKGTENHRPMWWKESSFIAQSYQHCPSCSTAAWKTATDVSHEAREIVSVSHTFPYSEIYSDLHQLV